MKKILPIIALVLSISLSFLYQTSDTKINHMLKSREWQSNVVSDVDAWNEGLKHLLRVEIRSTWKFLNTNTYLKGSNLTLFYKHGHQPVQLHILENGTWKLSDSYLLLTPNEFKDVTVNLDKSASPEVIQLVKDIYRSTSQQSRRVDVVNKNTIIITSLGQSSTVLYSIPNDPAS